MLLKKKAELKLITAEFKLIIDEELAAFTAKKKKK